MYAGPHGTAAAPGSPSVTEPRAQPGRGLGGTLNNTRMDETG
eukprot:SAG31_NODE_24232_length_486_cov_0.919897_2_plen_41_part_01